MKVLGFDNLKGGDLVTDTNGLQNEGFDQQAGTSELSWQANDKVTLKYIFGYSSFFYDRNTDVDLTSSDVFDNQFYVSQEAEYVSHELQAFTDSPISFSMTSGLFYYDSKITQRGDFYDSLCTLNQPCDSRYANPAFGTAANPIPVWRGIRHWGSWMHCRRCDCSRAKQFGTIAVNGGQAPFNCREYRRVRGRRTSTFCFGSWQGSTNSHVAHQNPFVSATDLQYQTRSERNSYAAYTQGVYTFNEHFALTLGARWARDQLTGEENLGYYNEDTSVPIGFDPRPPEPSGLEAVNTRLGSRRQPWLSDTLRADGTILNPQRLLVTGVPASIESVAAGRTQGRRHHLACEPRLDADRQRPDLHFGDQGSRAGGFNLVFFSANRAFKTESLISYELGYKGTLRDGTMQLNSAIYFYDYKNVETFGTGPVAFNPAEHVDQCVLGTVGADRRLGYRHRLADHRQPHAGCELQLHAQRVHRQLRGQRSERSEPAAVVVRPAEHSDRSRRQADAAGAGDEGRRVCAVHLADGRSGLGDVPRELELDRPGVLLGVESEEDAAPSYQRTDLRATWISPSTAWTVAAFADNVVQRIGCVRSTTTVRPKT